MNGTEALTWYLKAAAQGEDSAMHMLGACYARGEGCVNLAIFNLSNATASETFGTPKDVIEGFAFFCLAAEKDESYLWNVERVERNMTPDQISAGKKRAEALRMEFKMKQTAKQG
jgi:hypothetical protein